MLGPPKTAFASASSARTFGKQTPSESNDSNPLDSQAGTGRFFGRDFDSDDKDGERRGGRFGMNGRRGDRDDWNNRSRRTFDGDDSERRPRRNGDREGQRWETRGARSQNDDDNREEGRFSQKQGQGRARFEQPWFRGEKGSEAPEDPDRRQRGWGRDRRSGPGAENDWNSRQEQDPEWMETLEPEGQKQAHTAEDFQKWKERMKAENDKKTPAVEAQQALEELTLERTLPAAKPALQVKPETDKFFELFSEKKEAEEVVVDSKKHKTRFAALFSPSAEVSKSAAELKPANEFLQEPPRPASTDADQEGFQRILAMLGGKASKPSAAGNPLESLLASKGPAGRAEQPSPNPLAGLFAADQFSEPEPKPAQTKPQGRNSGGLEALLGARSPKAPSEKRNDSDFLLRLMQQSKIPPSSQPIQPPQSQQAQPAHTPGILQMPEALNRARQNAKSPNELPAFFNEPVSNNSRADLQDERQRYGVRNQIPSDFPPRHEYTRNPQDFPTGQHPQMQRPPGFEGGPPPPGWQQYQHQIPPQQHQHQQPPLLHAPPGIPTPGSRGLPFPGPPMPHNLNMPPPSAAGGPPPQERQRKYTGGGGGAPFLPPGMQPPPGFTGGNGAPPGFPPMPMGGNEGVMLGGQRGPGGGNGPLPPSMGGPAGHHGGPPDPRHGPSLIPPNLMDLFGMAGDRGRGGGVGGGPGPANR